jgi:murein L,D-transpeptidase YafK
MTMALQSSQRLRLLSRPRPAARLWRMGVVAACLVASAPAFAVSIELKDVASDRLDRQRAAAEGSLPLAGTPDLSRLNERLAEKGLKLGSPVMLRAFKSESELEVWIRKDDAYVKFATYPVCHWSGTLGPKLHEGDHQTPEGFYTVARPQMHHVGRWPRSLNLGFPNVYDKVLARNGSHILVHGGCSSVGCFAMTNSVIEEIYNFADQAIAGGQTFVPVHVFPFRMTDENLRLQKNSPWQSFWANLKEGYDIVERSGRPPRVSVCEGRYKFQELAPEEGAESGPLAPCGETLAALEALEQLSPAVLTQLSWQMNPPVSGPRSMPENRHLYQNYPNGRAVEASSRPVQNPARLREALLAQLQPGTKPLRPPCSMERASCRHFVAARDRVNDRRSASARKRAQHAAR